MVPHDRGGVIRVQCRFRPALPNSSRCAQEGDNGNDEGWEEIGIEQLKPVSKFFHGRISLTTLRLVRCVIVAEAAA